MRGNSSGALTFKCRRGRGESGTSVDHEGREGERKMNYRERENGNGYQM